MPRSQSLKNLTSVMGRVENAFGAIETLPETDQLRVLQWAEDEILKPLRVKLGAAK